MSLLDPARQSSLAKAVSATKNISGAILEVGVYQGGSLELMAKIEAERMIYGIDTFEGIPFRNAEIDFHAIGDLPSSFDKTLARLSPYKNVQVFKGLFPKQMPKEIGQDFSLVHLDVDVFESVARCLEALMYKVSLGGLIVIDDYAAPTCPGSAVAVNAFLGKAAHLYTVVNVTPPQITLLRSNVSATFGHRERLTKYVEALR